MNKILLLLIILAIFFSCASKENVVEPTTTTYASITSTSASTTTTTIETTTIYALITTTSTSTSTTTTTTTTTIRTGFRYDVPEDMEESPNEARSYKYDNMIVEKGTSAFTSPFIIAIRHNDDYPNAKLKDFAEFDQEILKSQVKIRYDEKWTPFGFEDKKIEFISYQFAYNYGKNNIFQRSVYLKCDSRVYIISMSGRYKGLIVNNKNDAFWNSVRID